MFGVWGFGHVEASSVGSSDRACSDFGLEGFSPAGLSVQGLGGLRV